MFNSLFVIASKQLKTCLLSKSSNVFRALYAAPNLVNDTFKNSSLQEQQTRWLRTSCCLKREERRVIQKMDEGVDGENTVNVDRSLQAKSVLFPDENTPNLLFDGVRFDDLHIIYIKVSKNNTIMSLSNSKGASLYMRSCGLEGFKNAKKGTNVAAQATAITLGMKTSDFGIRNVRVKIQGLGPGRVAAIKGLQMAGLNIVSISDTTPVDANCPRPRKVRRV